MPIRLSYVALALASLLLAGCYSFTATTLPPHIRTVVIEEVDNRTLDPVLANRLRDAIGRALAAGRERHAHGAAHRIPQRFRRPQGR